MNGKERRLRRILNRETGRSLVIAVDHGMALGAMTGIVDVGKTIRDLDSTGKVDCWLMTKGIYTHAFDPAGDPGVILRASGGATIAGCGAQPLNGAGQATCTTSSLGAGTHSITAGYGGDANNLASVSPALSQVVNPAVVPSLTIALASSLNPSRTGNAVTFTATVTGNAPTGVVRFTSNGANITGCLAVALTGTGNTRTAACTTSSLAMGIHRILAAYSGDANNAAASSAMYTQFVFP